MTAPALIKQAELRRMAAVAKKENGGDHGA